MISTSHNNHVIVSITPVLNAEHDIVLSLFVIVLYFSPFASYVLDFSIDMTKSFDITQTQQCDTDTFGQS